jgi:hypothetical protein
MSTAKPKKVRLKSIDDCRRLLQKTVNEFKGGVIDEAHARCLGFLIKIMIECIKDGELESRVAQIEQIIREKQSHAQPVSTS